MYLSSRKKSGYWSGWPKAWRKRKGSNFPVINATGNTEMVEVPLNDPNLIATDARVIKYKGLDYLTTISHLRLLNSDDCIHFSDTEEHASLFGNGNLERFGIEDCRVSQIDDITT